MPKDIVYESCSDKVGNALGPDVMKSVKHLIPDILAALPLLLYQGASHSPLHAHCNSVQGSMLHLVYFRMSSLLEVRHM